MLIPSGDGFHFFSLFSIALGLYLLPGIILSFCCCFGCVLFVHLFVSGYMCVPQIVGNAGTMFRSFH